MVVSAALFSLLPVCLISVRWASYFGDTSKLGVTLATLMFHLVHAFFLVACIWVALDPPFSPRHTTFGPSFLSFYYLGALSVGYFSGYFLLIFGGKPVRPSFPSPFTRFVNIFVTSAISVLAVLAPVALLYRNLPQIRSLNGPMLNQFAKRLTQELPTQGAVLLSDVPSLLWLAEFATAEQGSRRNFMYLDTRYLPIPGYYGFLKHMYQERWPTEVPKDRSRRIPLVPMARLLVKLAESNAVYYLHPSFGYYFEIFYPEPHGLVHKLNLYDSNALFPPPLTPAEIKENEDFWTALDRQDLPALAKVLQPRSPGQAPTWTDGLFDHLHLLRETNADAIVVGELYSRALDYWGVELQKAEQFAQAGVRFQRARELNPDNRAAQINLHRNAILQGASQTNSVAETPPKSFEDEFGERARTPDDALTLNGPCDEPIFCAELGMYLYRNQQYKQAAAEFKRARELAPELLPARYMLATLYNMYRMPDEALKEAQEIRLLPGAKPADSTNALSLLTIEASAHLAKHDPQAADACVQAAFKQFPGDTNLLAYAAQVFMNNGFYSNAVGTLDLLLKQDPDNQSALVNKGYASLHIGDYHHAIDVLSRALTLQPTNYTALFNRAVAYLRDGQLDLAGQDYKVLEKAVLEKTLPRGYAYPVYYGLGDVAYKQKDTNAALQSYELYLANAPTNTDEAQFVRDRMRELKNSPP
ncbi:membrane hypothetical protein [Verrucomicrobia bacterium]|nr:membrane hypothetical protein [Verrucomicrobiota bacterium]